MYDSLRSLITGQVFRNKGKLQTGRHALTPRPSVAPRSGRNLDALPLLVEEYFYCSSAISLRISIRLLTWREGAPLVTRMTGEETLGELGTLTLAAA